MLARIISDCRKRIFKKRFVHRLHAALAGLVLCSFSHAPVITDVYGQELRYQPITPHGNVGEFTLPKEPEPASGSNDILVQELRGIILVDNQNLIISPTPDRRGINIDSPALSMLDDPAFRNKINKYMYKPISMAMLNSLARDIITYYRTTDYPVVDVSIPEQDIAGGVVYVVVVEAKLGKAAVQGGKYFQSDVLADYVRLPRGQKISEQHVLEELRWLNESPFRRVNVELAPGENYGQTDVNFKVKDRFPWQFYLGYDDTGSRLTSLERIKFGAVWGNAFGRDHTASYQLTASPNFEDLLSHSGVYVIPFKNHDKLILYGSYATTNPEDSGIRYGGYYGEAGFIYDKKLRTHFWDRKTWFEHRVSAGLQYKTMNSTLDFGIPNLPQFRYPVADVAQIAVGYNALFYSPGSLWSLSGNFYVSPGRFSSGNNNGTFDVYRPDAVSRYCYGNLKLENSHDLGKCLKTYLKMEGQAASQNLLPSEMFGLGGYGSVRGYDTYALSADNALLMTAEIQTAPKSLGLHRRLGVKDPDQFSARVFYDHGIGWNNHATGGYFDQGYIDSVGAGFTYSLAPCFNIRFDYGWQLHNDLLHNPDSKGGRAHLSLVFAR
jgi:hemolysin activation/secretion protein